MAIHDLIEFADYLDEVLAANASEYRDLYVNWEPHFIEIDADDIKKSVEQQLKKMTGLSTLPQEYLTVIDKEVPLLTAKIYNSFGKDKTTKYFQVSETKGNSTSFEFRVALKSSDVRGTRSVFDYIKTVKRRAQRNLLLELDKLMTGEGRESLFEEKARYTRKGEPILDKDTKTPKMYKQAKRFLEIGHDQETTVARARTEQALLALKTYDFKNKEAKAWAERVLQVGNPVYAKILASPGRLPTIKTYKASIIGGWQNQSDATGDRKRAGNLQKRLNQLIEGMDPSEFTELGGSDSPEDVVVKTMLNKFHEMGTKKGRKTNIPEQKINNRPGEAKSKGRKGKVTKPTAQYKEDKVKLGGGRKSRTGASRVDLRTLIGPLNDKLPQQVAQNMKSPRLVYRTGRFAESARVTDVTYTPQGYPSIGYTYMKYPYQTFEPGFAQGSEDRDPRKLIDRSIRELAVQFTLGRFYTRRV